MILVYDVNIEKVNKINKFLKTYLFWIQNSVFEGELKQKTLKQLKKEIKKLINPTTDSIIIYEINTKQLTKTTIGKTKNKIKHFI